MDKIKLMKFIRDVMYNDGGCPIIYTDDFGFWDLWDEGYLVPRDNIFSGYKLNRPKFNSVEDIADDMLSQPKRTGKIEIVNLN